jgi:tetratricopeptide (TPR) repeat protein
MLRWENDLTSYQARSVTATFEVLFTELDRSSSDVAGFLTLLSFLDPERIQLSMLVAGAARMFQPKESPTAGPPHPTRNVFTKIRNWRMFSRHHARLPVNEISAHPLSSDFHSLLTLILSPIRLTEAVQHLQRLSLVGRVSHDDQSALRIHDLVQYMINERAKKVDTYREFLRSAVSLVCRAFGQVEDTGRPECWPECEKFMPHLHSLNERWSDAHGVNLDLAEADVSIADYLTNRGRYGEAEATCKRSVERFEEGGSKHRGALDAADTLAWVYYRQGRYDDAETASEQVIEGRKKTLGADHIDTLASTTVLAFVYREQGRFTEAEELLKRILAGYEKNAGPDHYSTLSAMDNLAGVYTLQGRYADSERLLKRTLAGKEKNLGPNHTSTLFTVHNLALAYRMQHRYAEAEEFFTRALRVEEAQIGPDNPETLMVVFNLAHLYWSQKRHREAEEYFNRAFSGRMQQLGAGHPRTSQVASDLAKFYRSQGRGREADALLASIRRE